MKINKLKIFNSKGKMKLCATSLAGIMAMGSLTACSDTQNYGNNAQEETVQTKVFEIGDHVISVPIDDPTEKTIQYEYHEGYTPIGISVSSFGRTYRHDGGACILYSNDTEVECSSSKMQDGVYVYNSFGFPIDFEKQERAESSTSKEFGIGEHIISIPIDADPTEETIQYEIHEGYEPVGIATSKYGGINACYGGGCILYVNTEPVTCTKIEENENDVYTSFGTPCEKEQTKVKK